MTNEELIQALDRLKVQTGSLACLGRASLFGVERKQILQ